MQGERTISLPDALERRFRLKRRAAARDRVGGVSLGSEPFSSPCQKAELDPVLTAFSVPCLTSGWGVLQLKGLQGRVEQDLQPWSGASFYSDIGSRPEVHVCPAPKVRVAPLTPTPSTVGSHGPGRMPRVCHVDVVVPNDPALFRRSLLSTQSVRGAEGNEVVGAEHGLKPRDPTAPRCGRRPLPCSGGGFSPTGRAFSGY